MHHAAAFRRRPLTSTSLTLLLLVSVRCDSPAGPVPIVRLDLAMPAVEIFVADTVRFHAAAYDASGRRVSGAPIVWESADTMILTVDTAGLGRARAAGMTLVIAHAGGRADTAAVEVRRRPHRLVVPHLHRLELGGMAQVVVQVFDANDEVIHDVPLTFLTANASIAEVDENGLIRGNAYGITAVEVRWRDVVRTTGVIVLDYSDCKANSGSNQWRSIDTDTTWRREDGPHWIRGQLLVGTQATLSLTPGTTVCFGEGASLAIRDRSALNALGTAEQPIVFKAIEPGGTWRLQLADQWSLTRHMETTRLAHVRLLGGAVELFGPIEIDSTEFRGSSWITLGGWVRLTHSLLVDASLSMSAGHLTFEATTIRHGGLYLEDGSSSRILGGRIEDSPGIGLAMSNYFRDIPEIVEYRPVRIVGAATYPAQVTLDAASMLLASQEHQDSLLGNGRDTLVAWGSTARDITLRPGLPMRTVLSHIGFHFRQASASGTVRMEPGAVLVGGLRIGVLHAIGTPEDPIILRDDEPAGGQSNTPATYVFSSIDERQSIIRHAEFQGASIRAEGAHRITVENALITDGSISLASSGSSLTRSRVMRSTPGAAAAVVLDAPATSLTGSFVTDSRGDGVVVNAANVLLQDCQIEGSAGAGVRVHSGQAVTIRNCNLLNNAGAGVDNRSATTVDAASNWWGHPDGPLSGDGVSGPVTTAPHLTVPASLPVTWSAALRNVRRYPPP